MQTEIPDFEYGATRQLARATQTSESYWNKLRGSDDGPPFVKIGRTVRYHIPTARAWLEAKTRRSTAGTPVSEQTENA